MESDIKHLCDLILTVMMEKKKPTEVKQSVIELKNDFNQIKYGFQNLEEAIKNCK